jgi:cyclic nucleotide gated channel, plant
VLLAVVWVVRPLGNIKVFLSATMSKRQAMHTRLRCVELWMKCKELSLSFGH